MKDFQKAAIILSVIEQFDKQGMQSSESNIQRAIYLLQSLFNKPLDYNFVLYKHNLHSFELSDDLVAFRGFEFLELEPVRDYGSKFKLTDSGRNLKNNFPKTTREYSRYIGFVIKKLRSNHRREK